MLTDLDKYDIIVTEIEALPILEKVLSTCNKFLNKVVSSQTPFGLYTNHSVWVKPSPDAIKCYCSHKKINYVSESVLKNRIDLINKWKVCTGKASVDYGGNPDKNGKRVVCRGFIAEPNSVCTQTFLVANAFDSELEAKNFKAYMATKFFRFMLSLRICSQQLMKEKYSFVPDMQDYSIVWTDEMLINKFGISDKEWNFIESKIK